MPCPRGAAPAGVPRGRSAPDGLCRTAARTRRPWEFRRFWDDHEVGIRPQEVKRYVHPELGRPELNGQRLIDPGQSDSLLVYTAVPAPRATRSCSCSP
ncbi:hypothetical protein [Pseudonocardia halophobica]|uniref:MmyB family transcriptional regulator n=1 Tax=Pseudonocardia halophobica TaxID=29401 RepID=UPI0027BA074A|nr:hypothetical protein [Pseudonocardia halophobica]